MHFSDVHHYLCRKYSIDNEIEYWIYKYVIICKKREYHGNY